MADIFAKSSIFFIIQIFSSQIFSIFSSETPGNNNEFWLTTELMTVDWKKGCLTTAFCHEPKFQLINTINSPIRENMQINWPVTEDIVHDQARSFVTHWTKGSPEEVSLICQIVGTDPTFGFARVCDESQPVKIFKQSTVQQQLTSLRSRRHDSLTTENIKILVEVRGKCFNATLAVQKHIQRCPWCPDPNLHIHMAGPPDPEARLLANPGFFENFHSQDQFVQMCVFIGLALVTVITSTACGCLLVMYIKQKKQRKNLHKNRNSSKNSLHYTNLKQNVLPNGQYHQLIEPLKGKVVLDRVHRDDTRYETPWESKYHPIPFLLSTSSTSSDKNSNSTTTSPLDSTSALGSVYDRTNTGRLIMDHSTPNYRDDSPNGHYMSASTINRHRENV